MARTSTAKRLLFGAAAVFTALALLAVLFGPRLLSGVVAKRAESELSARGIVATIEGLRIGLRSIRVGRACIDYPEPANGAFLCLEAAEVDIDLLRAARGHVEIQAVRVDAVEIDARGERGALFQLQEAITSLIPASEDAAPDAPPSQGEGDATEPPPIPPVEISRALLRTGAQGLPLEGVELTEVRVDSMDGHRIQASVALVGVQEAVLELLLPVDLELPSSFEVDAMLSREGVPHGNITFSTPLAVTKGPVRVALSSLNIEAPHTAFVGSLSVDLHGARLFDAERLQVALREWTTDIEDLYLAGLELEGATIRLPLDAEGRIDLDGDPSNGGSDGDDDKVATGEGGGDDTEDEAQEAAGTRSPFPDSWSEREWWAQLPQRISLRDVTIMGARGDDEVFRADLGELDYSIRVINTQADLGLDLALTHLGAPMGELALEAVWDWAHSALQFNAQIEALDLNALTELTRPYSDRVALTGTLGLDTTFNQRIDRSIRAFEGSFALDDFTAQLYRTNRRGERVGVLSTPAAFDPIRYTWSANRAPDAPERRVDWHTGDLSIGEARFVVLPSLVNFRLHRRRIIDGIDLYTEIPEQPAQRVLDAVPDALLGPIARARLRGPIAWRHAFPIRWVEGEDGERRIDLDVPTISELVDDAMTLEFLPHEVDVRRLNDAFEFLFRGPDDSINRTLRAPAPRRTGAVEEEPLEEGTTLGTGERWARLDDISYFLIAAQLYREDGRFFTNRGINWYQMRLVLEEALATGWPERGASTISMQLVKNVFLSHERSVERKLQELFLTYWMTRLVPKERILEVYLNVIEWGPSVNGVVDAAEHYFGVAPGDLGLAEAAWLSLITPAPNRRAPQREMGAPPEWMMSWVESTLTGMRERDWITEAEHAKALVAGVRFVGDDGAPVRPTRTTPPARDALSDPFDPTWIDASASQSDSALPAPVSPARDPTDRTRALIEGQLELRPGAATALAAHTD